MEQGFRENGVNSAEQRNSERHKLELDTRNLKFFKEDIFHLPFKDLEDSSSYRHLKHVFVDEDDYEDFKQDLVDFHCMRTRWKEDRKKLSRDRGKVNSCSSEQLTGFAGSDSNYIDDSSLNSSANLSPKLGIKQLNSPVLDVPKNWIDLDLESMPMMEFFQNDEHFQEFDRVFETFKTKKRYASNSSLDKYRWSPHPESGENVEAGQGNDLEDGDTDVFGVKIDDIFADFFDNDDAFKHFEEEFEKFQFKRHSKALNSLHRNSVCDLIEDLKAFCDSEETKSSRTENALQVESKLSLPKLWNKGGEWDYIFSKIRQHGKLASGNSDTGRSDLTVRYDSDSGDCLLDDLSDCSESNRDTGYYSEARFDGNSCSCPSKNGDCQFTCHHNCLPLIQLECKSTSHDPEQEDEGAVLTGETSLSDLNSKQQSQSSELSSEPATEKDETDSGYRSGTIPDEKLPHKPSEATLNREELKKRIAEFNRAMPGANFALKEDETSKDAFQGFIKVTLNLVRPISMSLGARPPSIYEVLTREHIIEQNTQNISFYMPRDTVRSIHATSIQTTKEVVASLLKKFHILDHPRKFALYEQELKNNKIAKLRRVKDHEFPLAICLSWDMEGEGQNRLVLQENETGEIDWDAFCVPELNNFMLVLDREENECIEQLKYKYKVMKRLILQRMKELRQEAERQKRISVAQESVS